MNCMEEYSEIFERYPLTNTRVKKERNIALQNWRVNKNDYVLLKSHVCRFINENRIIINSIFIKKAICPLIYDSLNNNEYEFINELIETIGIDESQKISLKDIFDVYCEFIQWKKSPIQIANEILPYSNSKLLLEYKFNLMEEEIYYSIHELPVGIIDTGILSGQNYIDFFSEFEEIAKKLNKKIDIENVKCVYDSYFDYLKNQSAYTSFEEYLNKNNIDYTCYFTTNQKFD